MTKPIITSIFTSRITRFKTVAWMEGVSFLVLLCVAMPLKYIWGKPWLVQNIGMIHGLLFVWYILLVIQCKVEFRWNTIRTLLAIVLSFLPLGTFYVTARMIPILIEDAEIPSKV
jgi:integral membrane protein